MKRVVSILSCVVLLLTVIFTVAACGKNGETDQLVIYNWADYIYDTKLTDFKSYYKDLTGKDIEITYVTFDTNETMLTRLMQGDSNVDVVCPSEYAIQKLIESNMLVPLNYFKKSEYRKGLSMSDEQFEEFFNGGDCDDNGVVVDSGNIEWGIIEKVSDEDTFGKLVIEETGETVSMIDYFVPYMYGTLGILYNKYAFMDLDIYDKEIMNKANWGILFNDNGEDDILSPGLTGNILMKDSIRDSYAATIFYLKESGRLDGLRNENGDLYTSLPIGQLINAVDDQLLELCRKVLTEQKSQLFGYEVDFGKDDLLQGNAIVDLAWSGDALYAVEESWSDELDDYELAYYVPNGAGNIWFDGWVVPKTYNPDHMEAIKIFINFLNKAEIAAENMLEIGYTSAVDRDLVRTDSDARAVLAEGYTVNCDYWERLDKDGKAVTEFDFDSWEEFEHYFFGGDDDDFDEMDDSNWRYPFVIKEGSVNRDLNSFGIMQDFGANNKKVVTMWNYARSAGVSALPLLGWTALAVAVALGVLFAVIGLKRWRSHTVTSPAKQLTE
ncbi:MAG: extracellular solute-binding protein [Clostridiales bacterium]|nr:extracellular solute-binding protein [Clostridiales bacterium]